MVALTNKQSRFCEEYLIDCNATQAAIRAGYSAKTAKDIGCQNLAKLYIKEEIARQRAELSAKVGNRRKDIMKETMRIAYAPNSNTVSTGDKLRALELCGKECEGGIWTDKLDSGKESAPAPLSGDDLATLRTLARAVTDKGLKGPVLAQDSLKEKKEA